MYFIYALGDPRDGRIYYVGCTCEPLIRWESHSNAHGCCTADLINSELKDARLQPVMVILQTADSRDTASDLERHWIASLKGLVNKQPGGLPERHEDWTPRLHAILKDGTTTGEVRKYAAELLELNQP